MGVLESADLANFHDLSLVNGLDLSVVSVAFVDEFGKFVQIFVLYVDQLLRDEPVNSFGAGRSGQ